MEDASKWEFSLEHAGQGEVSAGDVHHGKTWGISQLELHYKICDNVLQTR